NSLVKEGHQPRFWSLSSIAHAVTGEVSGALQKVTSTVQAVKGKVDGFVDSTVKTVASGMSSLGHGVAAAGRRAVGTVKSVANRAIGGASQFAHDVYDRGSQAAHNAYSFVSRQAHGLYDAGKSYAQEQWDRARRMGHSIADVARGGAHLLQSGGEWIHAKVGEASGWAKHQAGSAIDWARQKAHTAEQWASGKVHSGLEWAKKTGVAGGIEGLKKGLSFIKKVGEYSPLGIAYKAAMKGGEWLKGGGLQRAARAASGLAGKAWAGIKAGYAATAKFAQSPLGQGLITGLSLAASFIPGGLVVKAVIGGSI